MDEYGKENNTSKWVTIGCISAVALTVCCAAIVIGGLYWLGSISTEGIADINVTAPISVEQGQAYSITVEIRNISGKEIKLDSMDIDKNILNGFVIVKVDPSYTDTYEYESSGITYQTYSFQAAIPPGGSLTVVFQGEAVLPGDFSGEVDVCIDSSFNCYTGYVRTLVK